MIERSPKKENIWEVAEIIEEAGYIDECVCYALDTGWVKETDRSLFIDSYLKPIHEQYIKVIQEVRIEITGKDDIEERMQKLIKRLNSILSRTERIGSTDPNNIIRSVHDYIRMFCRDVYEEYAAQMLANKIGECVYQ